MGRDRCPQCGQRLPTRSEAAPVERLPRLDCQAERPRPRPVARPAAKPEPIQPRLSDHALLRYLERVKGVDVKAVRQEIMSRSVIEAIQGGATAVIINGRKMPVSSAGVIITVLVRPDGRKRSQNGRRPRDEIAEYFEGLAEELVG